MLDRRPRALSVRVTTRDGSVLIGAARREGSDPDGTAVYVLAIAVRPEHLQKVEIATLPPHSRLQIGA